VRVAGSFPNACRLLAASYFAFFVPFNNVSTSKAYHFALIGDTISRDYKAIKIHSSGL
jgi:hypothetical protein